MICLGESKGPEKVLCLCSIIGDANGRSTGEKHSLTSFREDGACDQHENDVDGTMQGI